MASVDSLEAMMTHIQTMEEAMVSVLMEAIMKQSALIDATILIVVDGPQGRKWAGRNHLRDAYLDGTVASVADEKEVVVEGGSNTALNGLHVDGGSSRLEERGSMAQASEHSVEKALQMMESFVDVKQERDEEEEETTSAAGSPMNASANTRQGEITLSGDVFL